ncbi:MAG: tail fiber domain-containing protein [Bacteroidota bacterium]|nr:tail fiber domain-containing protein [Bacteroidota bacterium]
MQLGGNCSVPAEVTAATLLSNREIPLGNNSFIFSNPIGGIGRVGIGTMSVTCTPGNLLEVSKGTTSSTSGLRLTDLKSATAGASTGNVLSVNPATGDVILVPDLQGSGTFAGAQNGVSSYTTTTNPTGQTQLGQDATASVTNPGRLLDDRQIPMNGFDLTLNMVTGGSVGGNFICGGLNNTIDSRQNVVFGTANTLGDNNNVYGANFIVGRSNEIDQAEMQVFGHFNKANGEASFVVGSMNEMNMNSAGSSNYALGTSNVMDGTGNLAIGYNNESVASSPIYNVPAQFSYIVGNDNYAYNGRSIVIGNKVVGSPAGNIVSIGNTNGTIGPLLNYLNASTGFADIANAHNNVPSGMVPAINISSTNLIGVGKYSASFPLDVAGEMHSDYKVSSVASSSLNDNIAASFIANNTGNNNLGTWSKAIVSGPGANYGGLFEAKNSTSANYAIFATVGASNANYAGYFNGNVTRTGTDNFTSDAMFKTNIDTISSALTIINSLKPRTFNYDTTNSYEINFSSKTQYGFIAQDVQEVLPELVSNATHPEKRDSLGNILIPAVTYKTLNYQGFEAINTKAIQELSKKNDQKDSMISNLQSQINQLAELINSCCQNQNTRTQTATNTSAINVELSDKDIVVLNQNVPNPFAEQTTITYNIPEKSGFAQIMFNDMKGQIIKIVDVKSKGKGELNVFANDLSTGMYTYSLYVDGKLVDTKKMVKTE